MSFLLIFNVWLLLCMLTITNVCVCVCVVFLHLLSWAPVVLCVRAAGRSAFAQWAGSAEAVRPVPHRAAQVPLSGCAVLVRVRARAPKAPLSSATNWSKRKSKKKTERCVCVCQSVIPQKDILKETTERERDGKEEYSLYSLGYVGGNRQADSFRRQCVSHMNGTQNCFVGILLVNPSKLSHYVYGPVKQLIVAHRHIFFTSWNHVKATFREKWAKRVRYQSCDFCILCRRRYERKW